SPQCAALFKHANHDRDHMRELVNAAQSTTIEIRLASEAYRLRFTPDHLADLKAVIEADGEKQDSIDE
ncbi:hypothetical protein, partial [uncultured Thiodictyon sp.]|uniref:hypothetical protein n=1 Tax=uncultured Thiodictyon sp. TaxID=1846217 RepID=UPI0025F1F60F